MAMSMNKRVSGIDVSPAQIDIKSMYITPAKIQTFAKSDY